MKRRLFIFACSLVVGPAVAQHSPDSSGGEVVATVDGHSVSSSDLETTVKAQLHQLRNQEYEIRRRALDDLITQKLLAKEAAANGTTPEKLLADQIASAAPEPTDGELEAFYLGQKDRLNRPFDQVKAQLRQSLKQLRSEQARQSYLAKLRAQHQVAILLTPPKTEVAIDSARIRGDAKAPVTIVEFSDFECPYCQRSQAALTTLLTKYSGRVRLATRDYPLRSIHPLAQGAAEAARCAGEQGQYWEYHDRLFANQNKLAPADLIEHARALKLNEPQFEACVQSGKYRDSIEKDVQEGSAAGVSGTPAFFINGVALSGALPESAFAKVIDGELGLADGR